MKKPVEIAKKITLVNWSGARVEYELKDSNDIIEILIQIVSGDEVAYVTNKNNKLTVLDSDDSRIIDYIDATYVLPLDKIEEFSSLEGESYYRVEVVMTWGIK